MGVSARPAWRTDMALLPSPLFYLPSPPPAQMTSMSPKLFPSVSPWEASYQALLIRAALLHRQCLDVKPCPNEPQESPLDLSSTSTSVSPPSSPFPSLLSSSPPLPTFLPSPLPLLWGRQKLQQRRRDPHHPKSQEGEGGE